MKTANKTSIRVHRGLHAAAIAVLFVSLPALAFAGGAQEGAPPTLDIPAQPRQYISPANGDGVQDQLELPFSSVVAPAEDMAIVEYQLTIFDSDGTEVFVVSEVEPGRRGFFGNVFGGEKPQVSIPDTLTWDGTYQTSEDLLPEGASNGDTVPDGEYSYQLSVIDDGGNFARSAPFAVTVDNTAPTIAEFTTPPYTIFSPNGDGVRETIEIPLSGSRELRWNVSVLDADGEVVYSESVENETPRRIDTDPAPPNPFVWDGTSGTPEAPAGPAPEGRYTIAVEGTDRAGNTTSAEHPSTITLSLSAADLAVTVPDSNNRFSPNGDGSRDELPLAISVSDADAVVEWRIEARVRGVAVRTFEASGVPPLEVTFDGRRDDGSVLADGEVTVVASALLNNGTRVQSEPLTVVIDTQPPVVAISADTTPESTPTDQGLVFGAGDKQRVEGTIVGEGDAEWTYRIDFDGVPIAQGTVEEFVTTFGVDIRIDQDGRVRIPLAWDGRALIGDGRAADGVYELRLIGRDAAGNLSESRPARATLDSRTPDVRLALDGEYLSPLTDSPNSEVDFRTEFGPAELVGEFLFEIRNTDGRVVRSEYVRRPFTNFSWRGLTNGGTVVPDGEYEADLRVVYRNGHEARSSVVGPVIVDRTPPRIQRLTATPRVFTPDGDGEDETVTIGQRVVPGDSWTGRLLTPDGEEILTREFSDGGSDFTWDGTGPDGRLLPDGDYSYVLSATDEAGNTTAEEVAFALRTVDIPAEPQRLSVTAMPLPFSPDGDGTDEVLMISLELSEPEPVARWEIEVIDPRERVFRSFDGRNRLPGIVRWDGRGTNGRLVDSATDYRVVATVETADGEVLMGETVVSTDILVIVEGDRLRIQISNILFAPFSADLFAGTDEDLAENLDTLRNLARILNRYPDREILVEGHAAHIFLEDPARRLEQEQTLIPLSRDRAIEVMHALIILGVDRNRMRAVGIGGARPEVPHSDRENLYLNRRVEFWLDSSSRR